MSRRPQHLLPRLQQWQLPAPPRPRLRPVRQPQHLLQLRHLRLPLRQHPHQRRLHAREMRTYTEVARDAAAPPVGEAGRLGPIASTSGRRQHAAVVEGLPHLCGHHGEAIAADASAAVRSQPSRFTVAADCFSICGKAPALVC
jgi:hypothetical protein